MTLSSDLSQLLYQNIPEAVIVNIDKLFLYSTVEYKQHCDFIKTRTVSTQKIIAVKNDKSYIMVIF